MLISMTGYGTGTAGSGDLAVSAELRSVNNRFYEFSARLPKLLQARELELKEIVRQRVSRGKVNLTVTLERPDIQAQPLRVNTEAAQTYVTLLRALRDATGVGGDVTLQDVLRSPDVIAVSENGDLSQEEWDHVVAAVVQAADGLQSTRAREGAVLAEDLRQRLELMRSRIARVEELSLGRADVERAKLTERVASILGPERVDRDRLEMEIVLLADKMDVTEEMVRFRSHCAFFLDALDAPESEGRKLSFLLQEMNREANTIGSKTYDAEIAHIVVSVKEELERIREQIQNVE